MGRADEHDGGLLSVGERERLGHLQRDVGRVGARRTEHEQRTPSEPDASRERR